ncbi:MULTISPECIES: antibiotic biosynthesis monooxygenase family protein [Pseudomonas]|uniref:Antibiotic biosynthesis monooxygenase n=1 Tax=Pseudomonas aphyarum TaxID=2942629 RepID=A0ABT5PIY3_9PSED|nr:antibiotic biosynthesis monooxygenase [Pseudomonas aphyarum]MDD0970910.1 antibiotic biosynthesis monooxygenase [Pseudomonas aphyarum]MDD1123690.1 antibiotic biosynthesis monooxygenase [Pseudomonas aphyarum]MDD1137611.1 antibiotic biosynthesis monooxygenase [Pseudomonas aphyarum]
MKPNTECFAVIFTSTRTEGDNGYTEASERMMQLVAEQPGFLGIDSIRGADGVGITVSYWESEAAILAWREHPEHRVIQARGRAEWYSAFQTRVCRVEREYRFEK